MRDEMTATKTKMTATKPKLLLVEDNELGRKEISSLIGEVLGYHVSSPDSIRGVKEAVTFEVFDTLLIDQELSKFDDIGDKIDGKTIDDGKDIADFCASLYDANRVNIYSTHVKLPSPFASKLESGPYTYTHMPKPLPREMDKIRELFRPFREQAEDVHNVDPLLQPLSYYNAQGHHSKRLRAYKKIYQRYSNWLDFKFESVGDCAWGVVCGQTADRRFYGKPQWGDSQFEIVTRDCYPTLEELKALAEEKDAYPFVVWNTRKLEFLEKQFAAAGPRLAHVPDYLRDYFGIATAPLCVSAYGEEMRDVALRCASQLTLPGQIEVVKQIYKRLYGTPALEDLTSRCAEAHLPVVVEIYDAKVDGIEQGEAPTAWVELRNLGGYRAVSMEPFSLELLNRSGVEHESQPFEYTVYEMPHDDVAVNIEPVEE